MSTEATKAPPDEPLMTSADVEAWLQIKRTKLYSLIDQGLPFHSLSPGGNTKRFYRAEVQAWLDARRASRGNAAPESGEATGRRPGRPRKSVVSSTPRKWIRGLK